MFDLKTTQYIIMFHLVQKFCETCNKKTRYYALATKTSKLFQNEYFSRF